MIINITERKKLKKKKIKKNISPFPIKVIRI